MLFRALDRKSTLHAPVVTESADAFSPTSWLLAEPVVESSRPKLSAITRQEVALTQPGPEVPGLRIGDYDALIPR